MLCICNILSWYKLLCSNINISTTNNKIHWTSDSVFVSTSWPNMHIISKLHEICRLHSLIQGQTFSSLGNIASLAKNQKSICPDLAWPDKMCVCSLGWHISHGYDDDAEQMLGLFLFLFDKPKIASWTQIIASIRFQICSVCCFLFFFSRSAQCQRVLMYQNQI